MRHGKFLVTAGIVCATILCAQASVGYAQNIPGRSAPAAPSVTPPLTYDGFRQRAGALRPPPLRCGPTDDWR